MAVVGRKRYGSGLLVGGSSGDVFIIYLCLTTEDCKRSLNVINNIHHRTT